MKSEDAPCLKQAKKELRTYASQEKARILQRFFKTGPGEYGEGDVFLGVKVPQIRKTAARNRQLNVHDTSQLLRSPIHEERLLALLILILQYRKADSTQQKKIYNLYLRCRRHINNWDLIDLSAEHIVGHYLRDKSKKPLYDLARSRNLWERRIAILSTFRYIKESNFDCTLRIIKILLNDKEDLIRKAAGWMLREIGKRDQSTEEAFLQQHYQRMPRTMLRYAIERFPEKRRQAYLKGSI